MISGASGTVGRRIVDRLLEGGFEVACQTRTTSKRAHLWDGADIRAFDPRDTARLSEFDRGADAVIFALSTDTSGATMLFSETTAAEIDAMRSQSGSLRVQTSIRPETPLSRITRQEVAGFVVVQLDNNQYRRKRPFIGHP